MMDAVIRMTDLNKLWQEAATICPRPGLQVVTRYTSYTHLNLLLTRCLCWPANQSRLVTLTLDILTMKVVHESRVTSLTWATSVPILVFLGLSISRLRLDVRDIRQTASSLNAPT